MAPTFDIERDLIARGYPIIAGVDEVGRGPIAGPVYAAAAILDPNNIPEGLDDSKKLSETRRLKIETHIMETAQTALGICSVAEIDEHNILRASHIAMVRAIQNLPAVPDFVLIDGNMTPRDLTLKSMTVIKGDARSQSIAAASIVAKNRRDYVMRDLAQQFPGYGWETNMGYPTLRHKAALVELGVTPHHRRSFKPVHNMLFQG
ncbi:MAG: ribonuclease HII [Planktomarina sp.]